MRTKPWWLWTIVSTFPVINY